MHSTRLALVPLLLIGCAAPGHQAPGPPPSSYDFYLDTSVDPSTQAAVVEAAHEWSTMAGAVVRLHSGQWPCDGVPGCFNVYVMSEAGLEDYSGLESGEWLGVTEDDFIVIVQGLDPVRLQVAATHEMGHALGLIHPCAPGVTMNAVMNPVFGLGSTVVTDLDVAQYHAVH
jgi:hypothetical protein